MADFDYSQHFQIAAIIIFPLALFGFVCNLCVAIFIRKMPSLNNSFGYLTMSQAIADGIHQAIFAFYIAPCIFFRNVEIYSWSEQFGFVLLGLYEVCGMSHVFISLNRLTAVFAPLTYTNVFKSRNAVILICFIWIAAFCLVTFDLKIIDCGMYIPFGDWIFAYRQTAICLNVMWYASFLKNCCYTVVVAMLDTCAVLRLHCLNTRGLNSVGDAASARRRSREMNLVYQTTLQGVCFILELISYFLVSPYGRNKWEMFFLTTVSWTLVHGMDGFIVLSFNRDFRRQIKKMILRTVSKNPINRSDLSMHNSS